MRSSTFSANEITENILHCCYVCSFVWRLLEDFSYKIGLRRTTETYKWNMQRTQILHPEDDHSRRSSAEVTNEWSQTSISPMYLQGGGTGKIPTFYSRSLLQAQNMLLGELSLLGYDAVNIGKQLTDVLKDSYASIFRVKQFESQISELRKCLLHTNICKNK